MTSPNCESDTEQCAAVHLKLSLSQSWPLMISVLPVSSHLIWLAQYPYQKLHHLRFSYLLLHRLISTAGIMLYYPTIYSLEPVWATKVLLYQSKVCLFWPSFYVDYLLLDLCIYLVAGFFAPECIFLSWLVFLVFLVIFSPPALLLKSLCAPLTLEFTYWWHLG